MKLTIVRAGKVKSQTPKVCSVDRSKKVTGRAKKRKLYNKLMNGITGNKQ